MRKHITYVYVIIIFSLLICLCSCNIKSQSLIGTEWSTEIIDENSYVYQQIMLFGSDTTLKITSKSSDGTVLETIEHTYFIEGKTITVAEEVGIIDKDTITFGSVQFKKFSNNK